MNLNELEAFEGLDLLEDVSIDRILLSDGDVTQVKVNLTGKTNMPKCDPVSYEVIISVPMSKMDYIVVNTLINAEAAGKNVPFIMLKQEDDDSWTITNIQVGTV